MRVQQKLVAFFFRVNRLVRSAPKTPSEKNAFNFKRHPAPGRPGPRRAGEDLRARGAADRAQVDVPRAARRGTQAHQDVAPEPDAAWACDAAVGVPSGLSPDRGDERACGGVWRPRDAQVAAHQRVPVGHDRGPVGQ